MPVIPDAPEALTVPVPPVPARRRERLSTAEARRLALAAQSLAGPAGPGESTTRSDLGRLVSRLGAVQIDSVNVVARAHLLPLRSRLGPYDRDVLAAALSSGPRARSRPMAWEYWGHEASLVDADVLAALRWRMARAESGAWGGMVEISRRRPELVRQVVDALAHGPLTARRLQEVLDPGAVRPRGGWGWNWSEVKKAVEFCFWAGRVACAGRTSTFERRYDLPGRVWPAQALGTPWPDEESAADVLVERAARALGVGTVDDVRDHFRLPGGMVRAALDRLVEEGRLLPVAVEGWDAAAWRHPGVPLPRAGGPWDAASTLLAPFDPLVWHRPRTERVFGFRYRLEIYVPEAKRVHGYYVLPFLHRGRLVARTDLKADRARGALLVRSAWSEAGCDGDDLAALARELHALASWLGLDRVEVCERGDAAAALAVLERGVAG